MSRYARKVDKSQRGIVEMFESQGCSVSPIQSPKAGLPDLLVGFMGVDRKVESKNPPANKTGRQTAASGLSEAQRAFDASWRGSRTNVAQTPAQALELVRLWRAEAAVFMEAARALAKEKAATEPAGSTHITLRPIRHAPHCRCSMCREPIRDPTEKAQRGAP